MRIGVISDTHGLLRPEALDFLQGSDRIVHGGDIGGPEILDALAAIAPLTVVRGNNDGAAWADGVPDTALLDVGGLRLFAIHDLAQLRIDPVAAGIRVVVSGHSHRPLAEQRGPVLYLNPGSAGPRRFKLPISVAELRIDGDAITPRLVAL
ncbi:metallophosphoesterase family protein [Variovorax saccharolyticus]|uniref:metallophosphoesterase family protein n=1 Tax=Variovorax saccharolyticus TaxID=3053516 RepID=UPI002577AA3D|nr:metallophosphoesterase family protein [Variovorax sp. J31P216]MDM0026755.1 metallophosphoesterase family protein [Variovorax sp. J31P216]